MGRVDDVVERRRAASRQRIGLVQVDQTQQRRHLEVGRLQGGFLDALRRRDDDDDVALDRIRRSQARAGRKSSRILH